MTPAEDLAELVTDAWTRCERLDYDGRRDLLCALGRAFAFACVEQDVEPAKAREVLYLSCLEFGIPCEVVISIFEENRRAFRLELEDLTEREVEFPAKVRALVEARYGRPKAVNA